MAGIRALSLITLIVVAPALAPEARRQRAPTFRAGVEAVMLDVSVLDPVGRPIRGLTAGDFTVREDGRPQKLMTFTAVDLPELAGPTTPWIRDVAPDVRDNSLNSERRVLVLVLDDATRIGVDHARVISRTREIATQIISQLGPVDVAAVTFVADPSGGQEFTQDRARLVAAVQRYRGAAVHDSALEKMAPRLVIDTLEGHARDLAGMQQRRKALVWISIGPRIDFIDSGPVLYQAGGEDQPGITREMIKRLQNLFTEAQRANVNVYCIDPAGLVVTTSGTDPLKINREFLRTVSGNTGGFTISETDDVAPGIAQIFRETGSYYLLGYQPDNPRTEGRFRRIQVRVNRQATVRTRTGYFEPRVPRSMKPGPAPPLLSTAIASVLPRSDVPMSVAAAPFALEGRREGTLTVVARLEATEPLTTGSAEDVDLLVNAYDATGGSPKASQRLKAHVVLRPDATSAQYELFTRLDLRPGRYQLRLAAQVKDKAGSVYYDVDVPDFARAPVSLSGIVLAIEPAVRAAPTGALASVLPVVPTAQRTFARDDRVSAFLRVYQAAKSVAAPVSLAIRISDARGVVVFERTEELSPARFSGGHAVDYQMSLPIAGLAPGPHLLTIEATRAGTASARRDVRFAVQ